MNGKTGPVLRLTANIVVTASVTVFLSFVVMSFVFGWQMNPVMGDGMSPTFNVGHLAVIEPVETDAVRTGDVLIYRSPLDGELTAHRVVEIVETEQGLFFRTQADSKERPDPYLVVPENVTGRAKFQVPVMGHVANFARTPTGFLLLFGLPGLIITTMEVNRLVFDHVPRHKRQRQAAWTTGLKRKDWLK